MSDEAKMNKTTGRAGDALRHLPASPHTIAPRTAALKDGRAPRRKNVRFCRTKSALSAFFSLICVLIGSLAKAQSEPQYTGTFAMPSAVNPAAAGCAGLTSATAAFRQQWVGFDGAPRQFLLSVDTELAFLRNFHGLGLTAVQDKTGPVTALNLAASYSYHIYLDKGILGLGARFGVYNVKFESGDLHTSPSGLQDDYHQESDEALSGADDSQSAFDVGLGAFFQSEASFISLSLAHLTAPDLELKNGARLNVRPVLLVGGGRLLGRDVKARSFEPRLAFMTDFASWQLELMANFNFNRFFWAGVGVRLQDALPVAAGVRLRNGLDISYAYDISLSRLKRYNSGSHEVVARYSFDFDRQKPTKRYKSVRIL